jgi:hypothetical protein
MGTVAHVFDLDLPVIGGCSVPSCVRPATTAVRLTVGNRTVAGTLCDRCGQATRLAAFLLDLTAA